MIRLKGSVVAVGSANPKLVWHIANENNASSRSVSVVYDDKFDGSGRDYLIRNSEFGDVFKFQIFDVNGRLNRFEDKLAWVAYFNAGVRLVDLSDPDNPREVGYYVPKPNETSHPVEKGQGCDSDERRGPRRPRARVRHGSDGGRTVYTSAHGNHGPIGHVSL